MQRPTVDLPQPDSPTSPSVSPGVMSKLTPSTARTCAHVHGRTSPPVISPSASSAFSLKRLVSRRRPRGRWSGQRPLAHRVPLQRVGVPACGRTGSERPRAPRREAPRGSRARQSARVDRQSQRGWKAQPFGSACRRRRHRCPGWSRRASSLVRDQRERRQRAQQARCRDGAVRSKISTRGASFSTMRQPAYIIAITRHRPISATTPRSWVISISRHAALVAAGRASARGSAPGWSRPSAVVGSSAISSGSP